MRTNSLGPECAWRPRQRSRQTERGLSGLASGDRTRGQGCTRRGETAGGRDASLKNGCLGTTAGDSWETENNQ